MKRDSPFSSLLVTVGLLAAATAAGALLRAAGLQEATVVVTYVLAVIGVALATPGGPWCLIAAALSVLAFNFFFAAPTLSLAALDPAMPGTFAVMFVVALLAGHVAARLRLQARAAEAARLQAQALLDLSGRLQDCTAPDDVVAAMARSAAELLGRSFVWYPARGDARSLGDLAAFPFPTGATVADERTVALRALANGSPAGASTEAFGSAAGLYLPVGPTAAPRGVAGILPAADLSPEQLKLWRSVCGLAALALDRVAALRAREEAAVRAREERTRADLLRSISHDLRTPLTSISGNADVLLDAGAALDAGTRRQLLATIRDDASWLRATVENLLTVTRLEEGGVRPQADAELVDDLVEEALRHAAGDAGHVVSFEAPPEPLLVRADPTLAVQALVNLVNNAVAHTPAGSRVTVRAEREGAQVSITVADDGPGIPDAEKGRVFEAFHTSGGALADGTRSVGLGLAVCRAVARAHGGTITVHDNRPHGAVFSLILPAEEVPDV